MGLLDQFPTLDDETFEDLVAEARLLIPQFASESWTDHNVHDPGITFLELFAWLAEMQIYQLNKITDRNYEKFLRLVGCLSPDDAKPAKVNITFDAPPGARNDVTIKKDAEIITKLDGKNIVFATEEEINLIQSKLTSIITRSIISESDSQVIENIVANEKDDIYFAAFGEKGRIGSTLELGFDESLPKKEIQITFDLYDKDLPSPGSGGLESTFSGSILCDKDPPSPENDGPEPTFSVSILWEYLSGGKWIKLSVKKDTTLALNRSGRIIFEISSDMDKKDYRYWIRCRWQDGQYEIAPLVNSILLNTVSAFQIETVREQGTGLGIPDQKIELKKKPVLRGSLKILIDGSLWEENDDFESSGPEDNHYLFDPEKGEITFGNGLNGRIPVKPVDINISYNTSLGQGGNVQAGQIWVTETESGKNITGKNYYQATEGLDAESMEHARSRAKENFRAHYRAITSEDYEKLAVSTPGLRVARAKAIPDYNPDYPCINIPGSITVVIVPYTRGGEIPPKPGYGFLQTVSAFLDTRRLITADLNVIGPEYVKISVHCEVHLMKKNSITEVKKRVNDALSKFLDPINGGPDGKGWPFGRAVYLSEIYQILDKVEGVDYASNVSLRAEKIVDSTEGIDGESDASHCAEDADKQYEKKDKTISSIALVVSGEHKIEII